MRKKHEAMKQWAKVESQRRTISIPKTVQEPLHVRLEQHVRVRWDDLCRQVVVRFRGAFAYVDAIPLHHQVMPGTTPEERARIEATPTRLCRLGYLGSPGRWAFAFFKYSDEKYESSFLPSGEFAGTPEEAFDCAAQGYLQD